MIATLTAIMYIVSIADKTYNNKTVQKGSTISRINAEDGYQLYKFTAYASENNLIEGDNTSSEITQVSLVCQIFTVPQISTIERKSLRLLDTGLTVSLI